MKNYIIKIGLLLATMLTALPVSAYDFEVDGIYYTITSFSDFTCEVTSGDNKYEGDIVIPSEITYNSRKLSVTSIGYGAFHHCSSLTSVTIPNSVTSIEHSAFSGCNSLTSVTIPDSVTSIGYSAFYGCSSLTSVTIPDSVTSIGSSTFKGCSSLTLIKIPNSVTSIEHDVFSDCTSLKSVILPDCLDAIHCGLFYNCQSLESIEIPGSVETISQFYKNLNYTIYSETFFGCSSLNKLSLDYSYSAKPLKIGYNYPGYNDFESDSWGDWTQTITDLYIDRELEKNILVPNLEKLEIGENVRIVKVWGNDFDKLTTIYSYSLTPPRLPSMSNKQYLNTMVYVPEEAIDAYRNAETWKNFWNLAPINGINDIENDTDSDAPAQIYSINGMEMRDKNSLPAGIYIMRQGSKTQKIVVGR